MRKRTTGGGSHLAVAALLGLLCLCPALPAGANWLTTILKEAGDAGRLARKLPDAPESAALLRHIDRLPADARASSIAAAALPEGHWRLTNAAGETVTAATPEELGGALRVLVPEAADATGARLTFYVDEETVFRRPEAVSALPDRIDVRLAHGERTHAVLRRASSPQLYAQIERVLVVALDDARAFDEAVWQLARSFNRSEIRILALDPSGSRQLTRIAARDKANGLPLPEAVVPEALDTAFAGISGQTVVLSGRIEGRLLHYEPASGPARSVPVDEMLAAADRRDVNLLVLQSDSALQPGARNSFWQKAEVTGLSDAWRGASLGDFLAALAGDSRTMLVRPGVDSSGRMRLSILPAPAGISVPTPAPGGTLDTVTDLMTELAAGFMGQIVTTGVELSVRSKERQSELDQRIVPGIPSAIQYSYLALLLVGLMGLPVVRSWWCRLLPPRHRDDFGSGLAYTGIRFLRLAGFSLVFLPAVALAAAPVHGALRIWQGTLVLFGFLTAPFRRTGRRTT